MKIRFTPVGNMGCRMWWGGGDLRDRDLGGHPGGWLGGVNGPRPGKHETKFAHWCVKQGLLCVRTVDLFWAFQCHRDGFARRLDVQGLHQSWREEKERRRKAALAISTPGWKPEEHGMTFITMPKIAPTRIPWVRLNPEARDYLDYWYPDPGRWKDYCRREKKYFLNELARYEQVLKFWRQCGPSVRRVFHRCARFSNRRPESHPDYFVVRRDTHSRVPEFGFVEVKGPRESLRPSQRRFFPDLVSRAGQKVWLARFTMRGDGIRFGQFTATGQLVPRDSLFAKS